MATKTIYLVTHGEKLERDTEGLWIPDPGMTDEGKKMMAALLPKLKELLPDGKPSEIHAGTGRRQWEVAHVLGFASFARERYFTQRCGVTLPLQ